MRGGDGCVGRWYRPRRTLASVFQKGFLCLCLIASVGGRQAASAATGVLALDEAAQPVRAPDRVFLDTVALAGARLVAAGEHGVIAYSDDDGATWTQATVPVDATLTSVAFATPEIGWAVGNYGVILQTTDGGKSWQRQLDGLQANQLTLTAAQEAVAQGSKQPAAPNSLRRANIFMQNGPDKPFLSLLTISPTEVIAFGAFRLAMRTDDGGKTWKDWSLNIDDPVSHNIYGAAHIGSQLYLTGEAGLVFCSDADGSEFHVLPPPANVTLFGVLATGDGILVYGVAGNAFKSTDDGANWKQIQFAPSVNLTSAITLKSGAILIGTEDGKLFISHDQGVSFRSLPVVLPMVLSGMVQAPDGAVIVVGSRGIMRVPPQILTQG